jgi:xylose isomerase
MTLEAICDAAVAEGVAPRPRSGRQELIENTLGRYI